MNVPGNNSDLLAVDKQWAAVVILKYKNASINGDRKTLLIEFTLHCPLPPSGTPAQMLEECVFPEWISLHSESETTKMSTSSRYCITPPFSLLIKRLLKDYAVDFDMWYLRGDCPIQRQWRCCHPQCLGFGWAENQAGCRHWSLTDFSAVCGGNYLSLKIKFSLFF